MPPDISAMSNKQNDYSNNIAVSEKEEQVLEHVELSDANGEVIGPIEALSNDLENLVQSLEKSLNDLNNSLQSELRPVFEIKKLMENKFTVEAFTVKKPFHPN